MPEVELSLRDLVSKKVHRGNLEINFNLETMGQPSFVLNKKLIKEIKRSQAVEYLDELDEIIKNNDENFDTLSDEDEALISKSIDLIKSSNRASTSFLQRNFQVGYNKAARIMEALEQRGVVSPPNHSGKRDILINQ